jgi:Fe2+ or Zn2+ uptake regulation protein
MQQTLSFHNTTNLIGQQLQDSIQTAERQDEVIEKIFIQAANALSPSKVHSYCEMKGYNYLLTSVRRTINTLTNAGKLAHTGKSVTSPYGRPEGLWQIIK